MKHILVPTDFSKSAINALSYARLLFEDEEVTFTLVHTYVPKAIQMVGRSPMRLGHVFRSQEIGVEDQLTKLLEHIRASQTNIKHVYTQLAIAGNLDEVLKNIDAKSYDYVVMGSKGATGLIGQFVGNNTSRVVKAHIDIPLLLVPDMAIFKGLERVAFATNFDKKYSKEMLNPLMELYTHHRADLCTVQVYYEPLLTTEQQANLFQLEHLIKGLPYSHHVVPHFMSVEAGIIVFTMDLEIDMLVIADYKHSLLSRLIREPVVKKLALHTHIPLLILPVED